MGQKWPDVYLHYHSPPMPRLQAFTHLSVMAHVPVGWAQMKGNIIHWSFCEGIMFSLNAAFTKWQMAVTFDRRETSHSPEWFGINWWESNPTELHVKEQWAQQQDCSIIQVHILSPPGLCFSPLASGDCPFVADSFCYIFIVSYSLTARMCQVIHLGISVVTVHLKCILGLVIWCSCASCLSTCMCLWVIKLIKQCVRCGLWMLCLYCRKSPSDPIGSTKSYLRVSSGTGSHCMYNSVTWPDQFCYSSQHHHLQILSKFSY